MLGPCVDLFVIRDLDAVCVDHSLILQMLDKLLSANLNLPGVLLTPVDGEDQILDLGEQTVDLQLFLIHLMVDLDIIQVEMVDQDTIQVEMMDQDTIQVEMVDQDIIQVEMVDQDTIQATMMVTIQVAIRVIIQVLIVATLPILPTQHLCSTPACHLDVEARDVE